MQKEKVALLYQIITAHQYYLNVVLKNHHNTKTEVIRRKFAGKNDKKDGKKMVIVMGG